jgi:hypothetical protein
VKPPTGASHWLVGNPVIAGTTGRIAFPQLAR